MAPTWRWIDARKWAKGASVGRRKWKGFDMVVVQSFEWLWGFYHELIDWLAETRKFSHKWLWCGCAFRRQLGRVVAQQHPTRLDRNVQSRPTCSVPFRMGAKLGAEVNWLLSTHNLHRLLQNSCPPFNQGSLQMLNSNSNSNSNPNKPQVYLLISRRSNSRTSRQSQSVSQSVSQSDSQ